MKTPAKFLLALGATCLAFACSASAQLITYDTRPAYGGNVFTFQAAGAGSSMGQTFSNVSAVQSMTYNFFAGSGGNNSATTLSATFGQWNTGTNSFVGGTTVSLGTFVIPAFNGGLGSGWSTTLEQNGGSGPSNPGPYSNYASLTFDLTSISSPFVNSTYGYLTNSTNTYALILTNTSGSNTGLGLGFTSSDAFAYGAAYTGSFTANDWSFSQIVVAPGNQQLVPVPESSTVAAIAGAVLVAGLVIVRSRQRRNSEATPLAA